MKLLKNSLSLIFFLIGLTLLFYLIDKVGAKDVLKTFQRLNGNIVFIFILPITWYFLQSFAWYRIICNDGHSISLWHVFLTKITGEAVNTVTPLSIIGGDPYRVYLLQKKMPGTSSAASVVIDRTVQTIAVFMLLVLGLGLAWLELPLPQEWQFILPLTLTGFLLLILLLIKTQQKGVFSFISSGLKKIGIQKKRLQSLDEKLKELDEQIGNFYRKNKLHFFEVVTLHFIGRILGAVEIFIIANFLATPIPFTYCLYLSSLTVLINMVFVFIPGSLGIMEGGYGGLFYILKLDPAIGIAIQLVRRLRTFFWIFIGLLIILIYKPKKQSAQQSVS